MASKELKQIIQEKVGIFPAALIYAFLEWMLIIMLFLDGLISFAANEFASFFGLKIPCLLCTRIDHVLVHRDPDFYYKESICDTHGKDVSSLGYCHVHMSLSDVQRMCADCLLSFATHKKCNSDTYRSLVALLGTKVEISVEGDSEIHLKLPVRKEEDHSEVEKSNAHRCSCCGRPLRTSISPDRRQVHEIQVPSTVPVGRESMTAMRREESRGSHPLSHISYTELRITSDAESYIVNNDHHSGISENDKDMDEVMGVRRFSKSLDGFISKASAMVPEKHQSFLREPSEGIFPLEQEGAPNTSMRLGLDVKEPKDVALRHGLEELSWDRDLSHYSSKFSMLPPRNDGKEAEVGAAGIMNQSTDEIQEAECIDLNDAYKIAMANKQNRTDEIAVTNSSKDSRIPNPAGLPILRKRLSRDKSMDSSNGSNTTKEHWKNLMQRLKRRVHLDRKSLIALSAELDQERNASAVAANQAMAMITRLQEEKAAVQMEALHYQRLMEEQVEYDGEALQAMRNLLIRREKKIKALEEEVETYRERFQFEEERYGENEDDCCGAMRSKDMEDSKVLADTTGRS